VQVGVTFPQSEIGADPEVIRDYAQAAEDLGYEHLLAYDHVLGADPSNREGWRGYTHKTMFHEPLTLFSFLATSPVPAGSIPPRCGRPKARAAELRGHGDCGPAS
jgi:alkanesulfonate monooxygenase SsuD/methylene tetrahydromethanopterin reductase-like flavin-dependent oxidoreductase (luciferase family)